MKKIIALLLAVALIGGITSCGQSPSEESKNPVNGGGLSLQSCMVDGKLYGIPMMGNSYDAVPVMFIRADWLEALNLEVPTTMEKLKEVAHAFTYDDPDGNGIDDTYGLAILSSGVGDASGIFAAYNAYPGTDGMAFITGDDGKVTWGGTNAEGMKAGLQLLQDMYKDGSLAKNFITIKMSAYNSLPTEVMAENSETLKKLTVETIVKIITGDPVDNYDSFMETWYALGGEDVIADAQAWANAN